MKLFTLIFLGIFTLAISAPAKNDVADAPEDDVDTPEDVADAPEDVHVYDNYENVGCYKDKVPFLFWGAAIPGGFTVYNKEPIYNCYLKAKGKSHQFFAVQRGNRCYTFADARTKYKRYGISDACTHGRGADLANSVYKITTGYMDEDASKDEVDTPEDEADAPEDEADAPEDEADAPEDVADAPEDEADAPEDEADTLEDEADAPEDEADNLEDVSDAPEDEADAPEDEADTLEDVSDAPEDEADVPEDVSDAPEDDAEA